MGVAPEMRVRLAAEVRGMSQRMSTSSSARAQAAVTRAPEPAPLRQRQPGAEAHHRQRRVLAAGERQRGGRERTATAARPPRPVDGGQEQRDREGGGVEVAHVDARAATGSAGRAAANAAAGRSSPSRAPRMPNTASAPSASATDCATSSDHRARDQPEGGHEEVHDRREVIAPGVHLGQAHVGARAAGEVPDELDVVAEVERVGRERQVAGDGDEREERPRRRRPRPDHPAGPQRRHRHAAPATSAQGHERPGARGRGARAATSQYTRRPAEDGQAAERRRPRVEQTGDDQRRRPAGDPGRPEAAVPPAQGLSRRERLSPERCSR